MKKVIVLLVMLLVLAGCRDATIVSHNISKESDSFNVRRRIVFYNSITDTYMLEMIGNCSIEIGDDSVLRVTCKIGEDEYQKHYLGLSDNVTFTVEQLQSSAVSKNKYELTFKPQSIIPIDIEVRP